MCIYKYIYIHTYLYIYIYIHMYFMYKSKKMGRFRSHHSAQGTHVATGSMDNTAKLWDVRGPSHWTVTTGDPAISRHFLENHQVHKPLCIVYVYIYGVYIYTYIVYIYICI